MPRYDCCLHDGKWIVFDNKSPNGWQEVICRCEGDKAEKYAKRVCALLNAAEFDFVREVEQRI